MFKVINLMGDIYNCYGTFLDIDGDIQFILEDSDGKLFKTDNGEGVWKIFKE